jgi:hypothetical protein
MIPTNQSAEQIKHEAIDRVAEGRADYIESAMQAARRHLARHPMISSAVIKKLTPVPEGVEPRVLGAVLRKLVKEENLVLLSYESTNDRRSHCRPIAVWGKEK